MTGPHFVAIVFWHSQLPDLIGPSCLCGSWLCVLVKAAERASETFFYRMYHNERYRTSKSCNVWTSIGNLYRIMSVFIITRCLNCVLFWCNWISFSSLPGLLVFLISIYIIPIVWVTPGSIMVCISRWQSITIHNWLFFHGATTPSGPGPLHYRGFTVTLRHTTLGRTPLDEWSARRTDLCLTTHNTHNRPTFISWRDSNPQSQQTIFNRLTP